MRLALVAKLVRSTTLRSASLELPRNNQERALAELRVGGWTAGDQTTWARAVATAPMSSARRPRAATSMRTFCAAAGWA